MGIYNIKSLLEDQSFRYLQPKEYTELSKKLDESTIRRQEFIQKSLGKIETILQEYQIPHKISARPKNLHSIYRKMIRQNKAFEEIQDIVGIRLITDTVEHCYALLGIIHAHFAPIPNSFTDYIAIPKNNLYQSLHTSINLSNSDIVEVQIRTEEMHRLAEFGIAAHWRYKQTSKSPKNLEQSEKEAKQKDSVDARMDWIKQIMEWQQETQSPKEFLENLKIDLDFDQVFVFTPKGDVIKLPVGSTLVDFAYAVHSDLGNQCIGAKIDNKMARLDAPLKSGMCCEIITRKGQHPSKDWLEFVKTPRARSRIRKYLRENNK